MKEQGKDHWFSHGNRPFFGLFILEAEAVDLRVNAWLVEQKIGKEMADV